MEKQKSINAQLSQKINIVENNVDKRIDGLQNEIDKKFDNLQYSISRLANQQHVYLEEENLEEVCLSDTMVEEHCQQQLQERPIENSAEYSEGLSKSSDIGAVVCSWEKKEAISSLLIEEGSGKEAVEEPQKHNLHLPSTDIVYILPIRATQSIPEAPAAKAEASPFASLVQTFATISKTLAATHVAWHNGWLIPKSSWFKFGVPEPQ